MGRGPVQVFTKTIGAADTSCTFDFGTEAFTKAYLWHETMTTAADLHLYGSMDGTNYYRLYGLPYNTATTAPIPLLISSALTQGMVEIPVPTQYLKIVATGAACSAVSVKIACHH